MSTAKVALGRRLVEHEVQNTLGANDFELSGHARARGRVEETRVEEAGMISGSVRDGATSLRPLKRSKIYVKKARPGTKYLNHLNRTGLSYTDRHLSRYDILTPVRCYEGWRRVVNLTTFGDRNARH